MRFLSPMQEASLQMVNKQRSRQEVLDEVQNMLSEEKSASRREAPPSHRGLNRQPSSVPRAKAALRWIEKLEEQGIETGHKLGEVDISMLDNSLPAGLDLSQFKAFLSEGIAAAERKAAEEKAKLNAGSDLEGLTIKL